MKKKQEKKKKYRWILLLLCLILIAVLLYLFWNRETDQNLKAGFLPGLDEEALQAEVDGNYIRMQINSTPVFEDGSSEGNLYIGNPETNRYDMYVVITLEESGEVIYDSGLIPPGYYIDYDTLQVELEEGRHKALAEISYYNENEDVQSQSNIMLEVVIKN